MRARQFSLIGIGLFLLVSLTFAQTEAGNGVARVSLMRGDVTVVRGDSGDLSEAAINAPLVTGDRLLTGPGSRAELQFDYAHFLRLSANSEVRMMELQPERYLLAVAEGTVGFSRIDQFDTEVEVNTPSVSVRPVQKGNFRVTVNPDGSSEITVRDGQVEIYTPNGVERLGSGRTMLVRGNRDNPEFQYIAQARRDDFDNWNRDRDRLIQRSASYQYVDRSIPGAYELDAYGSWVNVAPYGMVWRPRVATSWAPYRHGRWSWVDYWGWSWVSYDSWGWAPFHYGRWFNSPGVGWCWYPGGRSRHYYSPAVVGWFGTGGLSVGVGFGNVGWVPLAPYEPFHRWWGGGWGRYYGGGWRNNRTYIDNSVNIVNNVNITNVYRNARVNNGYTVMDGQGFSRGASVRHNGMTADNLRGASSVRGQLPVMPDRGSLRFSDRQVNRGQVETRLARTENQQFRTRTAPTRTDRASFDVQRGAMEQVQRQAFGRGGDNAAVGRGTDGSVGRGVSTAEGSTSGRGGFAARSSDSNGRGGDATVGGRGGDATVGGRGNAAVVRGSAIAGDSDNGQRGGWRRFGEPVTRQGADRGATGANRGDSANRSDSAARGDSTGRSQGVGRGDTANAAPSANEASRGASARGSSDGSTSWRRFGEPSTRSSGRGDSSQVTSDRGSNSADTRNLGRGSSGRSSDGAVDGSASAGRGAARGSSGQDAGQQRLNLNPSIVRERNGSSATPSDGGSTSRGDANRGSSDSSRSGWRSFGRGSSGGIMVQGMPDAGSRSSGSARSSEGSSGSRSSGRVSAGGSSRQERDAFSSSPSYRGGGNSGASSGRSSNGGSVRSTPSYGGSSGGGRMSAPRSSGGGRMSAPSAPSMGRGGSSGGGGMRSSGGGGGGGRSSGGAATRGGGGGRGGRN